MVVSGATLVVVSGLLIVVASLAAEQALEHVGLSSCNSGSRAQAQWLWCRGLTVLQHVESTQTRDQTHVPCIGR